MDKVEFLQAFRSLEAELAEGDPDMEQVLLLIFETCIQHRVPFVLNYDPSISNAIFPIIDFYTIGKFESLAQAVEATVSYVLTSVHDIRSWEGGEPVR